MTPDFSYQVTGFAYQGDGVFDYQGSAPVTAVDDDGYYIELERRRRRRIVAEDEEIAAIAALVVPYLIDSGD